MERFIGLDVHSQSCTFVVTNQAGKHLRTDVVETNGQSLTEYIRLVPGRKYLCMEEGTQSQWLSEILAPHVHGLAVIWPEKKHGNKNDELDALELAERMRTGRLGRKVFKAPATFSALRQLASCYAMVTKDVARTKNRIKSIYRGRGIAANNRKTVQPTTGAQVLPGGNRLAVEILEKQLEGLETVKEEAQKQLLQEARKHKDTRILRTAPGIGPVRSAQLLSIVVTPHRFRTNRQLWSYCGLGIVMRSSADWVRQADGQWARSSVTKVRGLNRNHSRVAKNVFMSAATTVVSQMKNDPLHADYQRLLDAGTKPNLARLTIARKIASITLAMWKRQEVYNPEEYRKTTE